MAKHDLIDFCRALILDDDALRFYNSDREKLINRSKLSDKERASVLNDDYAELHRGGVPLELLFQIIILAGVHPIEYMRKLQTGLNYVGLGAITGNAAISDGGSYTPSA